MKILFYATVIISVVNLGLGQTTPDDEHAWTITPTYVEVTPGMSSALQLRCERKKSFSQDGVTPYWIRVEKRESDQWKMVAEVKDGADVVISDPYVTATSNVMADAAVNFVELVWSEVTESALGVYRCEDMASAASGFIVETSPEMEVAEASVSTHSILKFWNSISPEISQYLESNNSNNTQGVESFKTKVALFSQDIEQLAFETTWFDGDYAMLMPDTGCPLAFSYLPSYMQVHEESSRRGCFTSDQTTHLVQPLRYQQEDDCFLRLQFCESGGGLTGRTWPDGSYCINKKQDYACPSGMTSSSLALDFEHTHTIHEYRGDVVTNTNKNKLPFCCSTSGKATLPISIATATPFYLYRRGRECQQVQGMNVTSEILEIDTEHGRNLNTLNGEVSPDIDLVGRNNGVPRVHLCYYVPL